MAKANVVRGAESLYSPALDARDPEMVGSDYTTLSRPSLSRIETSLAGANHQRRIRGRKGKNLRPGFGR